jgi:hypothetical protein
MDLFMMCEPCFPSAKLLKFMYLFSLHVSSSQDFPVWLLKVFFFSTRVSPTKYTMCTHAVFSSITKPNSMSSWIKEGYLT